MKKGSDYSLPKNKYNYEKRTNMIKTPMKALY